MIREGKTVCISVAVLFSEPLAFGRVEKDEEYYDLYNEDGELACMDGEEVVIEQVGDYLITFRNDNGESSVHFALTRNEAELAIIGG